MSTTLIGSLVQALLKVIPEDAIKKGIGALLDNLEDYIKKTPNVVDDAIVLPIVEVIRKQLGINE